MSDELAARLVEEGHPELAQQLEQKRLAGELRDANRPDLAERSRSHSLNRARAGARAEPQSEAELVARELARLNQGWMRLKA